MPRPSNLRTRDLEWNRELAAAREASTQQVSRYLATRNGATLHNLYLQLAKQRRARERQARLAVCGLLPSVLALVLHLSW